MFPVIAPPKIDHTTIKITSQKVSIVLSPYINIIVSRKHASAANATPLMKPLRYSLLNNAGIAAAAQIMKIPHSIFFISFNDKYTKLSYPYLLPLGQQ